MDHHRQHRGQVQAPKCHGWCDYKVIHGSEVMVVGGNNWTPHDFW